MTYTYLLAGENLDLAQKELEGLLGSQNLKKEVQRKQRIAITKQEPKLLKRLALTHEVSQLLSKTTLEELEITYRPKQSFSIRAKDLTENDRKEKIENELGEKLSTEENSVDLENPKETIKAYILEDEVIIGKEITEIDRGLFEKRKNQKRPFSSPVSLDPVLARVLVNLSEVSAGGSVLDTFCGTGGILIEAGLCGIAVAGTDVKPEMIKGTRKNLEEYGVINHDIREEEVINAPDIFDRKFDAVITDLPYGKASFEENRPVEDFLKTLPELTDGKAIFMYNEKKIGDIEADFEIYVHKSLTRYIFIQ